MGQNTSHAVMAQRVEPKDSLDYFPTPPWATRALCEWIANSVGETHMMQNLTAWEPACGEGHMAKPLDEYFASVTASDVMDYGYAKQEVLDFLFCGPREADWIITNPPFRLAEQFVATGLARCTSGVAMLVRTAFLESVGRYEGLFKPYPPSAVLQFSERVPMHKGKLTATGSTATAYCWVVWRKRHKGLTEFGWIPPCRKRLERASDYGDAR
jgi:hypothetical protein